MTIRLVGSKDQRVSICCTKCDEFFDYEWNPEDFAEREEFIAWALKDAMRTHRESGCTPAPR